LLSADYDEMNEQVKKEAKQKFPFYCLHVCTKRKPQHQQEFPITTIRPEFGTKGFETATKRKMHLLSNNI
jgi:hypothetical protein